MSPENLRRPSGYPPVTEIEELIAAADGSSAQDAPTGTGTFGPNGKAMVDGLAAVFDKHRQRIDAIVLDPAIKRDVLDLLDAVFLDILQAVLSESSNSQAPKRGGRIGT